MLGATVVIQLDTVNQHFLAYTIVDGDDGFSIEGGKGYIVNTPTGGMVTFTGTAWDNQPEPVVEEPVAAEGEMPEGEMEAAADGAAAEAGADDAAAAPALSTFKNAWAFVVTSDIHGMDTGTAYTLVAENLRTGTIATQNITTGIKRSSAVWADLNRKSVVEVGDKLEIALYDDRGRVVSGPFQRTVTTTDIRNAFFEC